MLITRFLSADGVAEISTTCRWARPATAPAFHGLIRQVRSFADRMTFRMECYPAFNYARDPHETRRWLTGGAKFFPQETNLALAADIPLAENHRRRRAEFTLKRRQSASFELHGSMEPDRTRSGSPMKRTRRAVSRDGRLLARVASHCTYHGPLARDGASLGAGPEAADV